MAQMRVDEVLPSKSGKAWRVKSGGKWYNAFGDSGIEGHVGKLIEAEITTHEKYGEGIGKYKVIEAPSAPTQGTDPKKQTLSSGSAPWWMPFASNTVAHAIQAGYIKEPNEIKVWVLAAKDAAESADSDVPL